MITLTITALISAVAGAVVMRELLRKKLKYAFYDPLTGLANYHLCLDQLKMLLAHAKRSNKKIGVFFLDLNGFKKVNDTHGHAVGDKLLVMVSKRIIACTRQTDVICRRSGDEFIICCEVNDQAECEVLAARLDALLSSAYKGILASQEIIDVSASIGISMYPETSTTAGGLLESADKAMYSVKGSSSRVKFAQGFA